jgi:gluconolactonase
MKKRFFIITGMACSVLLLACQKNVRNNAPADEGKNPTSVNSTNGAHNECSFFDPQHLVSASQHCILDTIQKGFKFTEGPAVDKRGNVFFTDQPDDRIYRWDASSGQTSLFLQGTGRANGMAFDKNGNLIACADMHGELWKIKPDGSHEVLVSNYNSKLLNGPNDVWINPVTGGMYITDPMFPRGYWDNNDPRKTNNPSWPPVYSDQGAGIAGHVYYLAPGSHTLVRVTASFAGWTPQSSWPNGVAGTADGKKLYINKWNFDGTGGIWVFNINPDGSLSNMQPFVPGLNFCDGMSVDENGNVYVSTNEGLVAYNPAGTRILTIPTGGGSTNNVFAGTNNKILFITGGGPSSPPFPNNNDRIMSVKMNVKGSERF